MSIIYVDIETLPATDQQIVDSIKDSLSAPKNYKDPEKIAKWIEDNLDSSVRKTALSGLFGKVLCIGYAIDDNEPECLYSQNDEELSILSKFREIACTTKGNIQSYCSNTLVGHNAIDFDIPFLSQRMMINGLPPLFRHGSKLWDMSIDDIMSMFACGKREHYSLDNLCKAFDVPTPKNGINGSRVYDFWLDGKHNDIAEYCLADVAATRSIYKAMSKNSKSAVTERHRLA